MIFDIHCNKFNEFLFIYRIRINKNQPNNFKFIEFFLKF